MKKLYMMSGPNAAGKSSIPKYFIESDPSSYGLPFKDEKTEVQICPLYNMAILGKYSKLTTSGGVDGINNKAFSQNILKQIWCIDEDIMMEGIFLCSRVWVKWLSDINNGERELIFLYPNTTLETCYKRIEGRSGKKKHELSQNGLLVEQKKKQLDKFAAWIESDAKDWKVVTLDTESYPTEIICNKLINDK